jgi:ribose transport system permease protein
VIFVYALILALYFLGASLAPSFSEPVNISEILRQSIVLGLVTIGQVYVLLGGGLDMSLGMTARVVGLGVAVIMGTTTIPPFLVIIAGLLLGALIGLVNGLLITRVGAAPFIVTLGMMGVLAGVALAITDGPTDVVPGFFLTAYDATLGLVPIAALVMLVVWAALWFVLNRTAYGRNVYAVGGSPSVARLSAIKVHKTQILTYVLAGSLAAMAGIFLLSRSGIGDPSLGAGLEFDSIVAASIGGVSLFGGRGSIVGAFGAVILVTMIGNLFDHLHVSGQYQQLILGLVILISVSVYRNRNRP